MTPALDPSDIETITYFALRYLSNIKDISPETSMELANTWRKHIHHLNQDDLESCASSLLDELSKLPQIPSKIGEKLGKVYQHYLHPRPSPVDTVIFAIAKRCAELQAQLDLTEDERKALMQEKAKQGIIKTL